ncbi:hypothetical protein Tco_0924906 [Tanacetum coccineum]|uniref:Retrotransposon gag domain-containing protein n=1 Tax=Tanacetum coccineum TaxID=301880 RepID=A0ABQ5D7Y6_9ASTR
MDFATHCKNGGVTDWYQKPKIIMVNVFPPNHVDDLTDPALAIPEPALVELQEEEEDMEVDIKEEEHELELIFPYVEADPLSPPPPASDSEFEDVVEVEDMVKPEDDTLPNSVHKVGESSTATFLREDGDSRLPSFMRRDINSLFVQIASLTRRVCGRETAHALVKKKGKAKDKKFGNAEERVECKKLKKELEEARLNNTLLGIHKEQVEKDLYWTRVQAHEIIPPKARPLTQSAIERMITSRINEALTTDQARRCSPTVFHGTEWVVELRRWFKKTEMVFKISECAKGKKVKFAAARVQGHALTWWNTKVATMGLEAVNQIPWTEIKQLMTAEFCPVEERFNELALMCSRMVDQENVKVDAYIKGLSENIKGEVTSSKPTNLIEVVRMVHKLMEQKLQERKEREIEGNKRK